MNFTKLSIEQKKLSKNSCNVRPTHLFTKGSFGFFRGHLLSVILKTTNLFKTKKNYVFNVNY